VKCPSCLRLMKKVQFAPKGEPVPIDVCQRCQFLWFDSGELATVPKYSPPPKREDRLPQKAREALALIKVEKVREEAEAEAVDRWVITNLSAAGHNLSLKSFYA
jgi:Zn-finger nucleic acid-binding protein